MTKDRVVIGTLPQGLQMSRCAPWQGISVSRAWLPR
jgi:hypothetical protein